MFYHCNKDCWSTLLLCLGLPTCIFGQNFKTRYDYYDMVRRMLWYHYYDYCEHEVLKLSFHVRDLPVVGKINRVWSITVVKDLLWRERTFNMRAL